MPSWAFFAPYPGNTLGEECIAKNLSLIDRNSYDRCPSGRKVQGVNYTHVNAVHKGYRGTEEIPDHFQCDIIIPTYNNEDHTVECLNSIKKYTSSIDYRVIWVDNASKETSKVEKAISGIPHLRIDMPTNEGFVNATNKGIKASNADYICLLNNDTVVSDRWLEKLINSLNINPKLGIVGPMTMPINGDRIYDSQHNLTLHPYIMPIDYSLNLAQINNILEFYYPGQLIDISFVAFFCAVIKMEVVNKVGLLDTNFHLGMWDDNDYCIATRKFGYDVKLLTDTCIQHKGRTTFKLLANTENFNINELMAKNKDYLNRKWRLGTVQRSSMPLPVRPSNLQFPIKHTSWRDKIGQVQ